MWLDHITYQCTDYTKAAAFYSALMGWKVRNDDGKHAVMDIGDDVGGIIMTNGFVAPPAPAGTGPGGRYGGRAWRRTRWWPRRSAADGRDHAISLGHRAVEHDEGRSGAQEARPQSGRRSRRRFQSFHIKDPDGFDIQVTQRHEGESSQGRGERQASRRPRHSRRPDGRRCGSTTSRTAAPTSAHRGLLRGALVLGAGPLRPGNQSQVHIGDVGGAIIRNRAGVTHRPHLVRHRGVRPRQGRGRAEEARARIAEPATIRHTSPSTPAAAATSTRRNSRVITRRIRSPGICRSATSRRGRATIRRRVRGAGCGELGRGRGAERTRVGVLRQGERE